MLTHGSLFDGYGGLRRGLEDAGFQTKWKLDILNGHDITTESPADYDRVDLISGGPVCRKTSRAAAWHKQRTNESIYPHMLRFVAHLRPGGVLIEQPASVDRSLILSWAADLERLGYGVAGRIIDSQHWVARGQH
jgi:site-specific DNA-cytosine methylase